MRTPFLPVLRCEAVVYRRDTYRGRDAKGRFLLHYTRSQCLRRHAKGSRFCWQHGRAEAPRQ